MWQSCLDWEGVANTSTQFDSPHAASHEGMYHLITFGHTCVWRRLAILSGLIASKAPLMSRVSMEATFFGAHAFSVMYRGRNEIRGGAVR